MSYSTNMKTIKISFASCLTVVALLVSACREDPPTPPIVRTIAISEIAQSTATGGGQIESNGGKPITSRGVCWGLTNTPKITDSKTTDGAGDGAFISSITGLTPGVLYYVRAYATNGVGTGYGDPVSFKTSPVAQAEITTTIISDITAISAKSGGTIVSNGGGEITACGVCWSQNHEPKITDNKTTDVISGNAFTSSLTNLEYFKTYYVRAYATNSAGTVYGNEREFTTAAVLPTVTTSEVTNRSYRTATAGGEVTADGGSPVTDKGICYGTQANPKFNENNMPSGNGLGPFTVNLTGLEPNTVYHVRAYAATAADTAYGADVEFRTIDITLPVVSTIQVSEITGNSAVSGGVITSNGGEALTARGICWGTTENPTIANNKTDNGTDLGSFTSTMTNLLPGTTYHVRAYATSNAGTAYGSDIDFPTPVIAPSVTTVGVPIITNTTAEISGNVTSDGGSSITERGICWSTNSEPTINDSKKTAVGGVGSFTIQITGLSPNVKYYVRAYAKNTINLGYGNVLSFTTTCIPPDALGIVINNITGTSAIATLTAGPSDYAQFTLTNTSNGTIQIIDAMGGAPNTISPWFAELTGLAIGTNYNILGTAFNVCGGNGITATFTTLNVPKLTTSEITSISSNSAGSGGVISSDGGSLVTERGICWSTNANPTLGDNHKASGGGTGQFSVTVDGLNENTEYHIRAYAINNVGTAYGQDESFTTSLANVTDIDGNSYKVVQIGSQIWMAENLKTTKYNDGAPIQYLVNFVEENPTYCWYNNDMLTYKSVYGALYSGYTARNNKICPVGWRVPALIDIQALATGLGGVGLAGGKLKEAGFTHWLAPNTDATNSTMFTGLPGGLRGFTGFAGLTTSGYWWTISLVQGYSYIQYSMRLDNVNGSLNIVDSEQSRNHYSIRCIKN